MVDSRLNTPASSAAPDQSPQASPPSPAPRRRWLRYLLWFFLVLVLLLAALLGSAWWWSGRADSLAYTLQRVAGWLPAGQSLQAKEVTGTVRQGGRIGHGLAAAHDLAEQRVVRQLPADPERRHGRGVGLAQLCKRRREPRPQQHVVGFGVAAGHAQREGVVRRPLAQAGPGRQLAQCRGQARCDQKLAPRCRDGGAEGQGHGGSGAGGARKRGDTERGLGGSKAGACISNWLPFCA